MLAWSCFVWSALAPERGHCGGEGGGGRRPGVDEVQDLVDRQATYRVQVFLLDLGGQL